MSLSVADLRRKAKLGNTYAKWLLPLRKKAHLTLAAILLTNVAAASLTPLVIDSKLSGMWAVVISTLALTIFAEIMPQALFAQNALLWCGRLIWLLRLMIVVTYPIAKPLQLLLDQIFKHGKQPLHTRHELGLLVSEHLGAKESELDEDEVEIIRGALQLSEKKVGGIMTPIRNVFSLQPQTIIDDRLIDEKREYVFTEINLEGDAVTDRLQTVMTVVNGDGSRTETLVNKLGNSAASAVLANRTVTTTSADGKSVTIQRDTTGGGWFELLRRNRAVRTGTRMRRSAPVRIGHAALTLSEASCTLTDKFVPSTTGNQRATNYALLP